MRRVLPASMHWPAAIAAGGAMLVGSATASLARQVTLVPDQQPVIASDTGAPYGLDWGLGLRGAYTQSSATGASYETIVSPSVTFTRRGVLDQTTLLTDGGVAISPNGTIRPDNLHAGADTLWLLDAYSTLEGEADLTLNQLKPDEAKLPTATKIGPTELTGQTEVVGTRNLGRFDLGGLLRAERYTRGPTTLNNNTIVDNTFQNFWEAEGAVRVGFEMTPLLSVFLEGSDTLDKFDAPKPVLNKLLDSGTMTLRTGVSYKFNSTIKAEASIGQSLLDYADPTIPDATAPVYAASLTFAPDETLSIDTSYETVLGPSSDTLGNSTIDNILAANARYAINPWLTLRGSASWDRTTQLGSNAVENSYSAGVGADLRTSKHTLWTADYEFTRDDPPVGVTVDTHTVSVGVKFQR